MTQREWTELLIALLSAVFASILSAIEMAVAVTTKGRAERLVEEGVRGAERILRIASDPAPTINSLMFSRMLFEITSITLVGTVAFIYFDADWKRVLVSVGTMLAVSFILWGVAPRTLGRQLPVQTLQLFGGLTTAITIVLSPVAQLMVVVGNMLTPGRGYAEGPFATEAELLDMVSAAEESELIEAGESKMIQSVFELGDTLVKEVMVPRTDMVILKQDQTLRELLSLALRSGYSRIPVVGENIDDVLGIVYFKDASKRIFDQPDAERTETVGQIMRPAKFVPESRPVAQLLSDMQREHSHMVIVIDEFGGTSGIATIEDILEEIVGEIVDEYDQEIEQVVEVAPGLFRVSSRMAVDDMGELFGLRLDDDDVETVWGLMAKQLGVVPTPGARAVYEGIQLVAGRAFGRRHQVATVLVRRLSEEELAAMEEQEKQDGKE